MTLLTTIINLNKVLGTSTTIINNDNSLCVCIYINKLYPYSYIFILWNGILKISAQYLLKPLIWSYVDIDKMELLNDIK